MTRTAVTAFIGRAERGPLDEPVGIEDFGRFRKVFGGHCGFSFLSHAVQQYFMHGGESAVVVRVANRATRARLDVPAGGQFLHLQARQPGAHEFLRVSVDYDRAGNEPQRFNLVIQRLSGPLSPLVADQEFHLGLSMRHDDPRFVVDALQDSKLARLSGPLPGARPDETRPRFSGQPIPYVGMTATGSDGEELTDYDIIGSNQESTGLFALEKSGGFDLLCIPAAPGVDLGTTAFLAAERFCGKHRALLVCDPPASWTSAHAAVIGVRASSRASRNALVYFPRVRPRGESQRFPAGMPACGALAGLLAQRSRVAVWSPEPLGPLKPALTPVTVLDAHAAVLLERYGVNAFVPAGGGAAVLAGNVTLESTGAISRYWRRLDRRRLLLFVLKSIEEGTRWALQYSASATVAADLARQVGVFLAALHGHGALAGQHASQAFFVASRAEPDRPVQLRFGVALHEPNQFVVYEVEYRRDGPLTRHVAALEAAELLL